jgi:hypothetical protein
MKGIFQAIRHLALIALFMRAMLPAGWMPDAQAGLTLCSLNVALSVIHHDGGPATPSPDGHSTHEECPFAAAPHLASAPDVPSLTAPSRHAFAAKIDASYAATLAARFAPHAPRGPPSFA